MKPPILCILISLTCCKPIAETHPISDVANDGFLGNVHTVEIFASKKIPLRIENPSKAHAKEYESSLPKMPGKLMWVYYPDMLIDTVFEIPISRTHYNQLGNRVENIIYQNDNVLGQWGELNPAYLSTGSMPQKIDEKLFEHLVYRYNKDNQIESVLFLNLDGSFKHLTKYTILPFRKKIIDSTFYENGGLKWTTSRRLTRYGLYPPLWISYKSIYQFDKDNNIIVEGNVHYYYTKYDEQGNWIEVIKFYDGPKQKNPVQLRREIEYY